MTDTRMLVGSLSSDLFRVASLYQRGSATGAIKFLHEAKRWAGPLSKRKLPSYIRQIADEITSNQSTVITAREAETYLMYAVLLANHALHRT